MKSYLSICLLSFMFFSCLNSGEIDQDIFEPEIDYETLNEEEIQEYISTNNLNPQKSESGLYYIIKKQGTGKAATLKSNVTVYYKGFVINSSDTFEESEVDGASFNLENLIPGFAEGITYLNEGGEATLIIPSKIGYPSNTFPPSFLSGKVLIFDVKLIRVY